MVQYQVVIMLNLPLNGLEGSNLSEVKSDLAISASDIDLSFYSGSSSINTIGTISTGNFKFLFMKIILIIVLHK